MSLSPIDPPKKEANTYALPGGSSNYRTPENFRRALKVEFPQLSDYDPCPINQEGLRERDGLSETPEDVLCYFMNPPYDNITPWLKRAQRDQQRGITVLVLVRGDTSPEWFHLEVLPFAEYRLIRGRMKFSGLEHGASFPSILCVYRPFQSPPQNVHYITVYSV